MDLAPLLKAGCRRCARPFVAGDSVSVRQQCPPGRRKAFVARGDVLFALTVYHKRCVPPVWWHRDQVAGSRPASGVSPDGVPQR